MSSILLLKTFKTFNKSFKSLCFTPNQRISYLLTKLKDRKVIGVKGNDSYDYIQGYVTNDIRHLCPTPETSVIQDSIYSFMLNISGRVISDVFIYRHDLSPNEKQLLVEIDSQLLDSMTKFLKAYRIRRKVDINVRNDYEVWAVFPSVDQFNEQTIKQLSESNITFETSNTEEVIAVRDPRLKEMGFRLLVDNKLNSNETQIKDKIKSFLNSKSIDFSETEVNNYVKYRYRLGVGEGVKDFPIELCFPLECNGDFLHGISFYKGCYVGQELTARIYHTGVIRKRLMPIEIESLNDVNESLDIQNITTNDNKNVGKLRNNSGIYGLALLRVEDCIKSNQLMLSQSGLTIKCSKPFWWPKEYSKQSLSSENAEN